MGTNIELWLLIAAVLIVADIILIGRLLISRLNIKEKQTSNNEYNSLLKEVIGGQVKKRKRRLSSDEYFKMKQVIQLDKTERQMLENAIDLEKIENESLKKLGSRRKIKRLRSIVALSLLDTDHARLALEKAILNEKDYTVRLYIANALADIGHSDSIPILVQSLINSHRFYRAKVNMLIADFGDSFNSFVPLIINSNHFEMKELIIDYAALYYSENTKTFLVNLINNKEEEMAKLPLFYSSNCKCCKNCVNHNLIQDKMYCKFKGYVAPDFLCKRYKVLPVSINPVDSYMRLVYKACDVLVTYYPEVIEQESYYLNEDPEIRNYAIKALANISLENRLELLLTMLDNKDTAKTAGSTITRIIERNPRIILTIADAFRKEVIPHKRKELAEILSGRIEYFILKLVKHDKENAADIIREILLQGRTNEIIDFLNKNKDLDVENELLAIVREVTVMNESVSKEISKYMAERLLKKIGVDPYIEPIITKVIKKDKKLEASLYKVLLFSLLFAPILYMIRFYDDMFRITLLANLERFVISFNYYLVFYSLAINGIYIILLLLSASHAKQQEQMWRIKNMSLLFKKKMLPSVSILAPAFNEEKTIIESANSLLNLKYPDYELIIINDGSKDNTMDTLIKHFNLKRVDYVFDYRLKTKQINGIYRNNSLPKLIVIDKENGGKADSLNAGINIANKEYFCGIDADSLLEEEALLRLAALTLDEGIETPALGGNILPINGCKVEQGQIKTIRIPDNRLARLQTIEYLRAFMAGRLGWAKLNSLLIISGAFGLFRKERVISVGGYLTSSGKYEKDTVGEDMELVVRISRLMRELGLKYKIRYGYNANCWTEVPEELKTLRRQRYRWHKGLIDILNFHDKMIFNPRYGRTGMLAMPYFFFFEMLGPMLEFQGYLMVGLAFFLGLLNAEILLLLFICTILLGILISVSSLVIAGRDMKSFSIKDVMILIAYAIIENFGPRQLISFWRVGAFFHMLRRQSGWDKSERKGFVK